VTPMSCNHQVPFLGAGKARFNQGIRLVYSRGRRGSPRTASVG